jgi:hypothetical protein
MIDLPIEEKKNKKQKQKQKTKTFFFFETLSPRETCDKVDKTWAQTCNPQHPNNSNG